MMPLYSLVLFIVFLTFLIGTFFVNGKNRFFAPSSIIFFMLTASSFVSLLFMFKYNDDIGWKTLLIFSVISILIFVINYLAKYFSQKIDYKRKIDNNGSDGFLIHSRVNIHWIIIISLSFIFAATVIWQYIAIYKQLTEFGYKDLHNIRNFYVGMRNVYTSNFVHFSFNPILKILLAIQKIFAFIVTFIFLHNVIIYRLKLKDLLLLLPLPFYALAMFLTSGRTDFIAFAAFFIVVLTFMLGATSTKRRFRDKFLTIVIVLFISVLGGLIFVFLNVMTGGSALNDPLSYIYGYFGSPFLAFDKLINGYVEYTNAYFGSHTLYSLYSFFGKLGFSVPEQINSYLPAVTLVNDKSTNIYSAIGRWYIDYGYFGIFGLTIFWFSSFSFMFYMFVERKRIGLGAFLYSYLIYPIVMFGVEDAFFVTFSISILYRIPIIVVLYVFLIKRFHYKRLSREVFIDFDSNERISNLAVVILGDKTDIKLFPIIEELYTDKIKSNELLQIFVTEEKIKTNKHFSVMTKKKLITYLNKNKKEYCMIAFDTYLPVYPMDRTCVCDAINAMQKNGSDILIFNHVRDVLVGSKPIYYDYRIRKTTISFKDVLIAKTSKLEELLENKIGNSKKERIISFDNCNNSFVNLIHDSKFQYGSDKIAGENVELKNKIQKESESFKDSLARFLKIKHE